MASSRIRLRAKKKVFTLLAGMFGNGLPLNERPTSLAGPWIAVDLALKYLTHHSSISRSNGTTDLLLAQMYDLCALTLCTEEISLHLATDSQLGSVARQ